MFKRLLIANRGEIAIRIARTAAELGVPSVTVYAPEDSASLHVRAGDEALALTGAGAAAYLDGPQILRLALEAGCDAIHPGYGFLSENSAFARLCNNAGVVFVGPLPETLELLGDKVQARALAKRVGAPVLPGSLGAVTLQQAESFLAGLAPGSAIMLKARAGGGGRGMREVRRLEDMAPAYERCRSEALQAFGNGDLYVEQFFPRAHHVEVQILGDGADVVHLWDRECSVQRQRQKLIEIAPAIGIRNDLRAELSALAVALAKSVKYRGLGTVEFLVDQTPDSTTPCAFIEANPRLQVEHTVTEAITGLDLVGIQIKLAAGNSLSQMGLRQSEIPAPRGIAVQSRINLETMRIDGTARPTGGTLSVYEPASGPGIRVDGFGYTGYRTTAKFDSLLAKLVVHAGEGGLAAAARKADRALSEFRIAGVATNIPFLRALLRLPALADGGIHTGFIEEHAKALCLAAAALTPAAALREMAPGGEGMTPLPSPLQGTIIDIVSAVDAAVRAGDPVLVMESMKMEHVITAPVSGVVRVLNVARGDTAPEGHVLAFIEPGDFAAAAPSTAAEIDLDFIRPDLAAVIERHRGALDAERPEAVARRRKTGQRTARENVDDLLDPNSFIEYGRLVVAARRKRHPLEKLIEETPADGMVMGLGRVNGRHFSDEAARCAVMAYDYTVLAGTQGAYNHRKMDRLIEAAERWRLPTVFFCEGGGGRPGDTEGGGYVRGFELWARMSAVAPLIGITSGRCFAGNASVLGCCDVIIAAKGSNIGMGGPAMIEGGGLGIFRPEEIGPVEVQQPNGVIDILAEDEADAVQFAKKYLAYFQGHLSEWDCADQRLLRRAIPENRVRVYDMRQLIETLADTGTVLELRPKFGTTMIAALLRIEGRPMGVIANDPKILGGAIDSDGADKAARFLQVCEAFDIPVLSLSDTPGMMVGPEVEKTALVRHCSRLFIIGANLTVPMFSVVLRKSYGLGALAMTGGSYPASVFAVAWPTGEFGGMGLEGAVKLGYRKELAAITDPAARKAKFDEMVAAAYSQGKALNQAATYHIDDVIDPADTRRWIIAGLRSVPPAPSRTGKKLRWIDAW
ncbi:MAG TPA: carboxyl transferase domain-containing protein [Steroidobacteraceae bacterium]|jgi:acetyl/propionyl-CoA carboxylase alpha subunit/acetyl-CoA carboxylase carboxyltransferase component|nr:carboxyl transferase domain-containing protein [Steroidobacteraceae bacterium]